MYRCCVGAVEGKGWCWSSSEKPLPTFEDRATGCCCQNSLINSPCALSYRASLDVTSKNALLKTTTLPAYALCLVPTAWNPCEKFVNVTLSWHDCINIGRRCICSLAHHLTRHLCFDSISSHPKSSRHASRRNHVQAFARTTIITYPSESIATTREHFSII